MVTIKSNGGVVLDDWANIYTMEGYWSEGNKRWIGSQDDIHFIDRPDVERVYLLSDAANQKPKFLIALALGIPCVGIDWVQEVAAEVCRWRSSCMSPALTVHLCSGL